MLTERRRKEIASLTQRKYRLRLGQTVVEGVRALRSARDAGAPLVEVLVTHDALLDDENAALVESLTVPVHEVDARTMNRISDVRTSQGVLAVVRIALVDLDAILGETRILVLDAVQDPGNAGTLIRAASWFGIRGIVAGPGTADPYSPKVMRASMGAVWDVQISAADDLTQAVFALAEAGFSLHAATSTGEDARRWHPPASSVLILGNEARGVSPELLDLADTAVGIPGGSAAPGTESLNVATAGAVLMYQWTG